MKLRTFLLGVILATTPPAMAAYTINWASPVFSQIVDSDGESLDGSYTFEIGVFAPGFTPEEANLADWANHWIPLDQADYSPSLGYFTASLFLADVPDYGTIFAEKQAYLWIYNTTMITEQTQWFVGRAASWVLPPEVTDCCGNGIPLDWSVSDMEDITPDFGAQSGREGLGEITTSSPAFSLQTATVIPEPGQMALIAVAVLLLQGRRRRQDG